jgi:hypothetical protein
MNNPCKECIVRAMCNDKCDILVNYLSIKQCRKKDQSLYKYDDSMIPYIAFGVRNKAIILFDNDTKWRWNNTQYV